MPILGIDASLTSTGYAYGDRLTGKVGRVRPGNLRGVERLQFIRDMVLELVDESGATMVAMEGYAMGRMGRGTFDIGELGGVLRLSLFELKIPVLLVPPSNLKMYATGKGNAKKPEVMAAMSKTRQRVFSQDDEADAYALLLMGLAYSDRRQRPRDPRHYQNAALRGCELIEAGGG